MQNPMERPPLSEVVRMLDHIRLKIMEVNQIVDDSQYTKLS
jgi:hypothetical protein